MNRLLLRQLSVFVLLFACGLSQGTAAQTQSTDVRPVAERLLGADILAAFTNVTHRGSYNFDREGVASNRYTETHYPDGRVVYREGNETQDGLWFENDDQLCFAYPDSPMTGGCFRVYKVENCYYYYSDYIPETRQELQEDYWTARSVIRGEAPQCEAAIS